MDHPCLKCGTSSRSPASFTNQTYPLPLTRKTSSRGISDNAEAPTAFRRAMSRSVTTVWKPLSSLTLARQS
jgi:hypothetical protein